MNIDHLIHLKEINELTLSLFYNYRQSDGDIVLTLMRNGMKTKEHKPKIENYYEITIPSYSLEDFRSHFRLNRTTFGVLVTRLAVFDVYNKGRGPSVNLEKELLMFLWYLGGYIISYVCQI